jgi:uncharacterized UPF0160 family protein
MEHKTNLFAAGPAITSIPRSFGTHDGTFHADEITACALLLLKKRIDKNRIFRTRDLYKLSLCEYVCDVGGEYAPEKKRFDHHQATYKGPLSSAGMVLEYLKSTNEISSKEYDFLNNMMVRGVDAHDNGKELQLPGVSTFSHIISNFTPISYEASQEEQDAAFFLALDFTMGHLDRLLQRFFSAQSCQDEIKAAMSLYHDCLVFDRMIPWMDTFFENDGNRHPAKFLIMPTGQFWKLRGIPPSGEERMKVRIPLPKEWAGLLEEELQKKTGIPGALFCHKGLFISVWKTKQDALAALKLVLLLHKVPLNKDDERLIQPHTEEEI